MKMKRILFVLATLALSACAHETTTLDRELALKLADRPPVMVQSAPPVVVNVNNGVAGASSNGAGLEPSRTGFYYADGTPDNRTDCAMTNSWGVDGRLQQIRQCFGSH